LAGEHQQSREGLVLLPGGLTPKGYWKIGVDGHRYHAHCLAWLYMTGEWCELDIDHRNGDRADNRWSNLREATRTQNNGNGKRPRNNSTGFKGVHFFKQTGRYQAGITVDGRRQHLGYFSDPEDAHAAYLNAAEKYFGEFARGA
jgi:hypothetical protein